jgi:hypothetical protein
MRHALLARKSPRRLGIAAVVLLLVAMPACGGSAVSSPRHSNGSSSSGDSGGSSSGDSSGSDSGVSTSDLESSYTDGFQQACSDVWSNTPDGNLYYDGTAYTEDDCNNQMDETTADSLSDTQTAEDQGTTDGYDAAFGLDPSGELCYGTQCWGREDFP